MYRLAFMAEHGLRSYKGRRAALSLERMAACPPKSVHFQAAEGHAIGLPFSWLLLLGQAKEATRALTQK
jgi:hypothetical protein